MRRFNHIGTQPHHTCGPWSTSTRACTPTPRFSSHSTAARLPACTEGQAAQNHSTVLNAAQPREAQACVKQAASVVSSHSRGRAPQRFSDSAALGHARLLCTRKAPVAQGMPRTKQNAQPALGSPRFEYGRDENLNGKRLKDHAIRGWPRKRAILQAGR